MKRLMMVIGLMGLLHLASSEPALAATRHYMNCNECHKLGAQVRSLNSTCLSCHTDGISDVTMNNGTKPLRGKFVEDDASDRLNSHPGAPANQTSHFWGGSSISRTAYGITAPPSTFYYSKNNISTGRVTCSACHDPHGDATLGKLLRTGISADTICEKCHTGFNVYETNGLKTHPVGPNADYAAAYAADNTRYNPLPTNTDKGGIRLANGKVMCTSCHGVHFTDSSSATTDGEASYAGLLTSDGRLLRTDGPDAADKSILCTACHTYKAHGKMSDGGESLGCFVCHTAHVYTTNNYFVLKNSVTTATYGSKTIAYTATNIAWNDNTPVTATGYCEVCHGSAETIPKGAGSHTVAMVCRDCHMHNVDGATYSFQNDANAATCGDCHGFPPYLNQRGDRTGGGVDGGYAYRSATHNYSLDATPKDESKTPHNAHAGGGLPQAGDYNFGSGIVACDPCHDQLSQAASHDPLADPGSYRDLAWSGLSTANGLLAPSYKLTNPNQWTCSAVYCHSNGGKRNASGTKVGGDFTTVMTPSWLSGSSPRTIIGTAGECYACHGNTSATMTTSNNSSSHNKHLGSGVLAKTYSCAACHGATATSNSALASGARLIASGGTHVNGSVDVAINASYSLGGATLGSGSYTGGAAGTCSTYCHSNGKGVRSTPDWDNEASGACGTCHGVTYATLTSGSHSLHINPAKADVSCDACHGSGAIAGTHTGHVDGVITKLTTAASCNSCHGIDAGDTSPTWGDNGSIICASCHSGATTTSYTKRGGGTVTALVKSLAATVGHNRPTASGAYPVTGKPAADKGCTACHLAILGSGHIDGLGNGDLLVGAFSCESCHTAAGSRSGEATVRVKTHANTDPSYTLQKRADFGKLCLACHDPHGTANIAMVERTQSAQNAKDATGNYGADVFFSAFAGDDSFDENDTTNTDDVCATCHTTTAHNTRTWNVSHSSYEGTNCTTTCHGHNGAVGGFMPTGGSACNSCHGNPPSTLDNRPAGKGGAHLAHVKVGSHDVAEDKFDCDVCHPGAASFTLAHADGSVSLAAGITNGTCANACHKSTAGDGSWSDSNGLNCDACHYWSATPTSAANTASGKALSATHGKHFDKGKVCVNCHADNAADTTAPRTHIDDHEAWTLTATNDGTVLSDRGAAAQDEATLDFTTATTKYGSWNDGSNSCGVATANNGLGCHATGAPTWGGGALACTACHSNKSTAAVNPTSGLHGVVPSVSGIQHDESFPYNAGASTGNCETCHTAAPSTGHQDGVLDATRGAAGNSKITFAAAVGYTDATAPTCAPSLTGCHLEVPVKAVDWKRKWHENSTSATGACAGCHGDWVNGWNTNVQHHTNAKAQSTHGTKAGNTWECEDCHGLESTAGGYNFTFASNDWDPAATETTLHGNGAINLNSTGTGFLRSAGQSGCPTCHPNWATDGKHAYVQTEWTSATIAADAVTVTCATCHGGLTVGANASNYWPDKPGDDAGEDNGGRHLMHMTKLAKAKYNEDITALLTNNGNGTSDTKQKELCSYCHTNPGSDGDHSETMPAEVNSMFYMWNKGADNGSYASGNCSNVNCHNGKATASTANFTWYGSGTQQCVLCHNDITVTTAGTTGATHQAHLMAPTFGKTIGCGECHGGNLSWAVYAVPSSNHINGTFKVEGGTVIDGTVKTYTGNYTDAATRAVGSCGTNLCHNNGKNAATAVYTWQTAIAGCAACHATSSTLGSSHDPHMNASFTTTFRATALTCSDCHDAVSAADMTGKTAHMDGTINLVGGVTYSGTPNSLNVTLATYGTCSGSCHVDHAGTPKASPTWNRAPSSADNCTICHASAPADGRHAKHVANSAYVTGSCAACHSNATTTTITSATHFNGSRNTGGSKSVVYNGGDGTCTNTCHLVASGRGDWLDAATLACTDCHSSTFIGKVAKNNTSGLHQATTALAHDDSFAASGTCGSCHNAMTIDSPATHVNGLTNDPNTAFGLFASYNTGTSSCSGSGVATNCHTDGGDWSRRWNGAVDAKPLATNNPGDAVCNNCHGDHVNGWRWTEANATTVDHTDPNSNSTDNVTSSHQTCQTCHGWGAAGYNKTWLGSSNVNYKGHGDGYITLNGPVGTGAGYNNTDGGCNAACHVNDATHRMKFNSGWSENFGDYGSANTCEACHAAKVAEAKHARHTNITTSIATDLSDCAKCHPNAASYTPAGGHADHKNSSVTLGAGIAGGTTGCTAACHASSAADGFWTDGNGLNCTACHYAALSPTGAGNTAHARPLSTSHNKHFNKGKVCADCHDVDFGAVGPLAHITDVSGANQGAIFTGKATAVQDEAGVTRTNVAFDDDGADNILGNADDNTCAGTGIGLGCHASGTPDWDNAITTCTACHSNETNSTYNPTSGLHNFSTATRHDDTLQTGNCTNCHDGTAPSSLHQDGTKNSAASATFTWNATKVLTYSAANGCNANCHTDGGDWRRKWAGAVDARPGIANNPGDAVCDNCHGAPTAFGTSSDWRWNEANGTSVDHTDPYAGNGANKMDQHSNCQVCHGWGNGNYNRAWRGASDALYIGHGDGYITMNGPNSPLTGTGYNNTSGGCAAACHSEANFVLNSNSGWSANFGNFGGGACNSCHGYPPLESLDAVNYPYGGLQKYSGSGRTHALAKHVPYGVNISSGWANCDKCHTESDHSMGATSWASNRTSKLFPKVRLNASMNRGGTATYTMGNADTVDGMGQCFNTTCHFIESPKWDCNP